MSRRFNRAPWRKPNRTRLRVEALEERCVPSNTTATESNGVLTITAGSAGDQITLTQTSTSESYTVLAADLNNNNPVSFTGVTAIVINSTGSQTLQIDGAGNTLTPGTPGLASFTITAPSTTSSGTLITVNIDNGFSVSPPGGKFNLNHLGQGSLALNVSGSGTFLGQTVVQDGSGDSTIKVTNAKFTYASLQLGDGSNATSITNANVGQYLSVFGGSGKDVVTVQGTSVGQNLATTLGQGVNQVNLDKVTVGGNVVDTGSGNSLNAPAEKFRLNDHSTVAGYVNVLLGAATSTSVAIGSAGSPATILNHLLVTGGSGNDSVTVTDANIGQNVAFNLGSGTNTMTVDSTKIQGNVTSGDSGTESLTMKNGTRVTGYVSVSDPQIVSGTFAFTNATIGAYLSIKAGGSSDTVSVGTSNIAQNVALTLSGSDNVTLKNSNFLQNLTLGLGSGTDNVTVTGSTVAQNLTVNPTSGTDTVTVTGSAVGGNVALTLGGADTVTLKNSNFAQNLTLSLGSGADNVTVTNTGVGGNAAITMGSSADVVTVSNSTFTQNLALNLGNAGNTVTITGSTVQQNATLNLGGGANTLAMTADGIAGNLSVTTGGGNDDLAFTSLSVQGSSTFTIGAGDDTLDVGDSIFTGTTTINGTSGTKTIGINTSQTDQLNTTFYGAFNLLDPTGKVSLTLGNDANDQAIFWASLTLQGNSSSTLNTPVFAEFYGGPPTATAGL